MEQLLTTKLYIPQLSVDLVPRPRLSERLDEGFSRKLTLVSAPTGFGKSTLVIDWLSERYQSAAWLSLDQGDNDPVRFWTYLIAAIQTIQPEIGAAARQIVSASQLRSTEPAVISLINEISQFADDLIVILDDYHVIEAGQIHDSLNYFLEHQPPNLHLIMITRLDPPISLARLRVHGQLIEIRAEDLQFSSKEAAVLLNEKMGLNLKLDHIEALNTHTESWVVGLQLAALSLKGQPSYDTFIEAFTGSQQFILDYLTEEVLDTLPDDQRAFLLHTSILERFCSELCQAVTDDPASHQLLGEIRKSNLFIIPLDIEGRWYRYQHLFAEVLYTLLARDHPGEINALHLKAAAWFDSEGYPDEAVNHALHSDDVQRAKELILKHWISILHRGEVATLLRWLDALPGSDDGTDPELHLARCWALFLSWQNSAVGPNLAQASKAYERLAKAGALDDIKRKQIAAQLAMMQSVVARDQGEHARSVAHAEEAARLMPQEELEGIGTAWNMLAAARAGAGNFDGAIKAYGRGIALAYEEGNLVGAYGCTYGWAMYQLIQGNLTEARDFCRSSIDRANRDGHGEFPAAGWLHIAMARIEMEQYRLDKVEEQLRDGLRIARPGGLSEAVRSGRYLRAHLAAVHGNLDGASEIFLDTARIVNTMDEPYVTGELNWQWATLFIKAGDLDAAREKLQILGEKAAATQHANLLLWQGWLLPRLLCAEGRYDEACTALEEPIRRARAANSRGELIRLLSLQSLALDALGERDASIAALREAIKLGAPEGYLWLWLNNGSGLEPLLRGLKAERDTRQALQPYISSLLDTFGAVFGEIASPRQGVPPNTLTRRELEIMRLIGKGYSNPEIADELVVTLNTIKKHTSNIYGKLGVRSRTQAMARANELNLL